MSQVDIVIWSGGYDSTLVLNTLCSENPKKSIWAYSIEWDMIDDLKTKKEKEARKNYLSYAKSKGYTLSHRTICIKADMGVEHHGYAQGLAWLSFGIPYLPENVKLYFGYYNDDAFWRYRMGILTYVNAAAKISNRTIALEYPLQYMSKCDILRELEEQGVPQSCVWTCENPNKNLKAAKYKKQLLDKMN